MAENLYKRIAKFLTRGKIKGHFFRKWMGVYETKTSVRLLYLALQLFIFGALVWAVINSTNWLIDIGKSLDSVLVRALIFLVLPVMWFLLILFFLFIILYYQGTIKETRKGREQRK